MKTILMLGLAASISATALAVTAQDANAQQRVKIYKYCLEEARSFFGSNQVLCRFDTLAQCRASMNSGADRCTLNVYRQAP